MAYNPYTDPLRPGRQAAKQASDIAQQASKRSMDMATQTAKQASDTAMKFAKQSQDLAARNFENTRISANSAGMSGSEKRAGFGFFAFILLFVLSPIIAVVLLVVVGFKMFGG